ncbi:NADPH-dependent FMN reductase [Alkalibacillus aidingensis]|uniref:NADPH-dependent FMN reductase n=1 Tax=Alkalibacillus aidingensis TaxID=2747607 RepID=UPI001660CC8B|nr:NADPH-dependent FMN reductase [Alkalibacillus aidingensis]
MNVLLINGTIIGSKTKTLLSEISNHLNHSLVDTKVEQLYLEDYDIQFADARSKEEYNEDTKELINIVEKADAYVIATPIFQGSIPGVLKNLFDLLSPKAMRYKPVAVVANGGTHQHHLVIENQLKPILDYFKCLVTPNYVYTHDSHFSYMNELIDEDAKQRIYELVRVFRHYVDMSQDILDGDHLKG